MQNIAIMSSGKIWKHSWGNNRNWE